jgi:hypothetical protein
MSLPQLPQRPLPPVHHVWVAGLGDGRRLYRTTLMQTGGVRLQPPRVIGSTFVHQHTIQPS